MFCKKCSPFNLKIRRACVDFILPEKMFKQLKYTSRFLKTASIFCSAPLLLPIVYKFKMSHIFQNWICVVPHWTKKWNKIGQNKILYRHQSVKSTFFGILILSPGRSLFILLHLKIFPWSISSFKNWTFFLISTHCGCSKDITCINPHCSAKPLLFFPLFNWTQRAWNSSLTL